MKVLGIYDCGGGLQCISKFSKHTVDVLTVNDQFDFPGYYTNTIVETCGLNMLNRGLKMAEDYDVIHISFMWNLVEAFRHKFPDKPIVLHYRGSDLRRNQTNQDRINMEKKVNKILVATPDLMAYTKGQYLPMCIDTELFKFSENVGKGKFCIIHSAREEPAIMARMKELNYKDVDVVMRETEHIPFKAMPDLYRKYEKYINLKTQRDMPLDFMSRTGLEALSCGLTVDDWHGISHYRLPEKHTAKSVVKLYDEMINTLG